MPHGGRMGSLCLGVKRYNEVTEKGLTTPNSNPQLAQPSRSHNVSAAGSEGWGKYGATFQNARLKSLELHFGSGLPLVATLAERHQRHPRSAAPAGRSECLGDYRERVSQRLESLDSPGTSSGVSKLQWDSAFLLDTASRVADLTAAPKA